MKDFYLILGVSITATSLEIKKAYRINAIKYHPDKNFGDHKHLEIFLEIKEAYDTLIDEKSRKEYDKKYDIFFNSSNNEIKRDSQNQKESKSHKFQYESIEKFFDENDRKTQQTPQNNPEYTPWKEKIKGHFVIFTLPKNIGKLIYGWSSLMEGVKPISNFQLLKSILKSSIISFSVIGIILLLIWQHWYFNLNDLNASRNLSITYLIIVSIILLLKYMTRQNEITFKQVNFFIGINGFSIHLASGKNLDVYGNLEINFNDVTDFISVITINNYNFQYSNTKFEFIWLNSSSSKPLFKIGGQHDSKEGNPEKSINYHYWLNIEAEKLWTIYLLDNMEKTLEEKGSLVFNLYSFEQNILFPYIKIGIGFITFLFKTKEITYNFDDIKRLYTKGTDLYIEHKNYQKTFFFFESGDKNYIPLLNLANRKFFLKAVEILLGYEIV